MTVLSSKSKIRFQDCDPFKHLNNARYIDYFLNARGDQILETYNIDIYGSQGFSWVVGSNQLAYFRPAIMNEEVCIETQVIDYSSRNLWVEMRMYSLDKKELKAILWVSSLPVDLKTMKLTSHNEELMKLFGEINTPLDVKYFEQRRIQLLKS